MQFTMMIIEPNAMRPTARIPKAAAGKFLVWSGAREIWRERTDA